MFLVLTALAILPGNAVDKLTVQWHINRKAHIESYSRRIERSPQRIAELQAESKALPPGSKREAKLDKIAAYQSHIEECRMRLDRQQRAEAIGPPFVRAVWRVPAAVKP